MGCGCNKQINQVTSFTSTEVNPDCSYTSEQLNIYKAVLFCIKQKELYVQTQTSEAVINSYLGIVTSAIYYPTNYCYFEDSLEKISTFLSNTDLSDCNYGM